MFIGNYFKNYKPFYYNYISTIAYHVIYGTVYYIALLEKKKKLHFTHFEFLFSFEIYKISIASLFSKNKEKNILVNPPKLQSLRFLSFQRQLIFRTSRTFYQKHNEMGTTKPAVCKNNIAVYCS